MWSILPTATGHKVESERDSSALDSLRRSHIREQHYYAASAPSTLTTPRKSTPPHSISAICIIYNVFISIGIGIEGRLYSALLIFQGQ